MSVTTFFYFCFVAVLLLVFYIVPKKIQWVILLIGSFAYYLTADVQYIYYLLATIIVTYLFGRLMQRKNNQLAEALKAEGLDRDAKKKIKESYKKKKRWVLFGHVFLVLGMLIVVKYTGFIFENLQSLSDKFNWGFEMPAINFILPMAISFYVFQSIGYIVDIYKDKSEAEKNPFRFALFMSFFPQLVQGPIARFSDLAPQLATPKKFDFTNIKFGFELMLYGVFKKLVLADRIGTIVSQVYGNWADYGRYEIILATVLYSIQIYADFSGCMDIITGVAKMFGVNLTKNFNHPYFSKTIPEFWRRWHISLGTWFKDYLFYPISVSGFCKAINRKCRKFFGGEVGRIVSGCVPIFTVWIATGVWHGASWKYVMWGLYQGILIALSLIFTPLLDKICAKLKINRECFSFRLFQMTRTFILCCIGRVINRAGSFSESLQMFKHAWNYNNPWVVINGSIFSDLGVDAYDLVIIAVAILIVWIVSMMQERYSVREKLEEQNLVFRWLVIYAAIFIIIIFGVYGKGFNAAEFLYRDF